MPYAVGALLAGWMVLYGRRARRQGKRLAAAALADAPPGAPVHATPYGRGVVTAERQPA